MSANCLILCSDRSHTFATLGAVHAYYIKGKLDGVKKYCCCGSAAAFALLLSCGLPPNQLSVALITTNIFEDAADTWQEVTQLLTQYFKRRNITVPTMQELHDLTGVTLCIEVFNITKRRLEVISHVTHPMISCITACCMAYSTPFTGRQSSYCGSEYIDSSLLYPVPHSSIICSDVPLCVYASPDLMSISTFRSQYPTKDTTDKKTPWWPWRDPDSAATLCRLGQQSDRDVKSTSLMYQRLLQLAVQHGPASVRYVRLLVNVPNTTASPEQRLLMLADWEDYVALAT